MQKRDGISTNVLAISSELTLNSDTCGLCFRRIDGIEEVDLVSMPCVDKPLPSFTSWSATFGPQRANSQRRREADDFDFSGFKRIQIVSKVSNPTIKEICELIRSCTWKPFPQNNLHYLNYAAKHWMTLACLKETFRFQTAIENYLQSLTIRQQQMLLDTLKGWARNEWTLWSDVVRELVFDEGFHDSRLALLGLASLYDRD
jgi:hypothetical protein